MKSFAFIVVFMLSLSLSHFGCDAAVSFEGRHKSRVVGYDGETLCRFWGDSGDDLLSFVISYYYYNCINNIYQYRKQTQKQY